MIICQVNTKTYTDNLVKTLKKFGRYTPIAFFPWNKSQYKSGIWFEDNTEFPLDTNRFSHINNYLKELRCLTLDTKALVGNVQWPNICEIEKVELNDNYTHKEVELIYNNFRLDATTELIIPHLHNSTISILASTEVCEQFPIKKIHIGKYNKLSIAVESHLISSSTPERKYILPEIITSECDILELKGMYIDKDVMLKANSNVILHECMIAKNHTAELHGAKIHYTAPGSKENQGDIKVDCHTFRVLENFHDTNNHRCVCVKDLKCYSLTTESSLVCIKEGRLQEFRLRKESIAYINNLHAPINKFIEVNAWVTSAYNKPEGIIIINNILDASTLTLKRSEYHNNASKDVFFYVIYDGTVYKFEDELTLKVTNNPKQILEQDIQWLKKLVLRCDQHPDMIQYGLDYYFKDPSSLTKVNRMLDIGGK